VGKNSVRMIGVAVFALFSQAVSCGQEATALPCRFDETSAPTGWVVVSTGGEVLEVDFAANEIRTLCKLPEGGPSAASAWTVSATPTGEVFVPGPWGRQRCETGSVVVEPGNSGSLTWEIPAPDGVRSLTVRDCVKVARTHGLRCRMSVEGEGARHVDVRDVDMDGSAPRWLDNKTIVYRNTDGLSVAEDIEAKRSTIVGDRWDDVVGASLDGLKVYSSRIGSIEEIDLATGERQVLYTTSRVLGSGAVVSPDRRYVVFSACRALVEVHDIYLVDLKTKRVCVLREKNYVLGGFWTTTEPRQVRRGEVH